MPAKIMPGRKARFTGKTICNMTVCVVKKRTLRLVIRTLSEIMIRKEKKTL